MMRKHIDWLVIAIVLCVAGLLLIVGMAHHALAHGEYAWIMNKSNPVTGIGCCGKSDCDPLQPNQITFTTDGWVVNSTGEVIPFDEVQPSEDGQVWRCRYLGGPKVGLTRCLFVGPGQM